MTRLRELRRGRGWSQSRLLHAVQQLAAAEGSALPEPASLRVMLSRWENGHTIPDDVYRRYLRIVLACTDADLGAPGDDTGSLAPGSLEPPEAMGSYLRQHLEAALEQEVKVDLVAGAGPLLSSATAHVSLSETLARTASGSGREALLRLACRYAEFAGWLHQDALRLDEARRWSERALAYARELGDDQRVAYVLMRQSNIAVDAGHKRRAAELAMAAQRAGPSTPRLKAVISRQLALGHAAQGDAAAATDAMAVARRSVAEPAAASLDPFEESLAYCTEAYIASEAGDCWLRLKQPDRAIVELERALAMWPDQAGRDRSLVLVRLARAYLAQGELEQASGWSMQASSAAHAMASNRSLAHLNRLTRELATQGKRSAAVREARDALAAGAPVQHSDEAR